MSPRPSRFSARPPSPAVRPSWSGLLQFNLVNAPVKAYPAVASREISHFHQLHADCGQRIRHAKHCPVHGPVDAAAIVKGYEYGRDQHVVLDPDELDALRPAQDRALRLERFVAPSQCDPILFSGRSLHLLPDGVAAESVYEVLRENLVQKARWAVGRLVLSGQRQLVLLRLGGNVTAVARLALSPDYPRGGTAKQRALRPWARRCNWRLNSSTRPVGRWTGRLMRTKPPRNCGPWSRRKSRARRRVRPNQRRWSCLCWSAPAERRPAGAGRENQSRVPRSACRRNAARRSA